MYDNLSLENDQIGFLDQNNDGKLTYEEVEIELHDLNV